jgi:hypothetical protein
VEHRERNRAVMLEVVGEVDRGHATPSELTLDQVAVTKGVGEVRRDTCGHEGRQVGDA